MNYSEKEYIDLREYNGLHNNAQLDFCNIIFYVGFSSCSELFIKTRNAKCLSVSRYRNDISQSTMCSKILKDGKSMEA